MTNKKDKHYVDNLEFYHEMTEWVKTCEIAEQNEESRPQLTNALGEKIMKVCEGTAYRYNFNQYTYADEFSLDAIENCVRYAHKFNYVKYKSPYSYFSRIAWQAAVRRIQKEDKMWKTKIRYVMNAGIDDFISELQSQDKNDQFDNDYIEFLQTMYDDKDVDVVVEKTKRNRNKVKDNSLENLFEDEVNDKKVNDK